MRRQARVGSAKAGTPAVPAFVPIVAETPAPASATTPVRPAPSIEVKLAGAVLRVPPGTDMELLTAVLRAIRASAT